MTRLRISGLLPRYEQEDQREHRSKGIACAVQEDGDLDVALPVDEADLRQHQQEDERVIVRLPEMPSVNSSELSTSASQVGE